MKYCRNKSQLIFLLAAMALISGCVGAGLRNIMTEERSYAELMQDIPNIPQGHGRVFIYSPKGGPNYPYNSMGDIDFLTIDKTVYRFGGASYFYLDIESGPHLLTVNNVLIRGFASNKKQYGENRRDIDISDQKTIYLQLVNQSASKAIDKRDFSLNIVEKNIAESELANLAYWNNSETTMEIE